MSETINQTAGGPSRRYAAGKQAAAPQYRVKGAAQPEQKVAPQQQTEERNTRSR